MKSLICLCMLLLMQSCASPCILGDDPSRAAKLSCGNYSKDICEQHSECTWYVARGYCGYGCLRQTTEITCKDAGCVFNPAASKRGGQCFEEYRCEAFLDDKRCESQGCVWHAESSNQAAICAQPPEPDASALTRPSRILNFRCSG
jgi:hypothetical protein